MILRSKSRIYCNFVLFCADAIDTHHRPIMSHNTDNDNDDDHLPTNIDTDVDEYIDNDEDTDNDELIVTWIDVDESIDNKAMVYICLH